MINLKLFDQEDKNKIKWQKTLPYISEKYGEWVFNILST